MRKLREYKGVTFKDGHWRHSDGDSHSTAASLIVVNRQTLTDEDHAELMRLKAEPYEPVPKVTLEDVVARFWSLFEHQMGFRLRGSIEADATRDLCKLIRTAFPHIDQEER